MVEDVLERTLNGFLMFRCFMKRVPTSLTAFTVKQQESLTVDAVLLWRPHISITSRSSSSLLVSLSSTRVCFLIPSKLFFLIVFEGASGISVGCPGLEGATQSFGAINPDTWRFSLSFPTGGQGTGASPHPDCSPEGKSVLRLPSSVCKLVEPGPETGISR